MEEFRFRHVTTELVPPECAISFRNLSTGVDVVLEIGSAPWVELSRLDAGDPSRKAERYDLQFVLDERIPGRVVRNPKPVDEDAKALADELHQLANELRAYARDILEGDFRIFPKLQRRAEEHHRRREQELYGPDAGDSSEKS